MSNLHTDSVTVNAGGTAAATAPPELPPCPECGGELMRYLNRVAGEDELLCLECWWAVPTAAFPTPTAREIESHHDPSAPTQLRTVGG